RDQLPLVLATLGLAGIPALLRHLHDPHEPGRAVALAALGHLRALDAVPQMVRLRRDASELVRQSLMEALGIIGSPGTQKLRKRWGWVRGALRKPRGWLRWLVGGREGATTSRRSRDPLRLAVTTLRGALGDEVVPVRLAAARALGQIGPPAAEAGPDLI